MTYQKTCERCGEDFEAKRGHARWCSDRCRWEAWSEQDPDSSHNALSEVSTPTLDEVRAHHEESKGKWTAIVREHLNRTLLVTGYVSAEDFDALGIPAEHSNLANAQMGSYSRQGYMEAISWRRSTKPSRKSGKFWIHKLTEKGRLELSHTLIGSSAGHKSEPDGVEGSSDASPCGGKASVASNETTTLVGLSDNSKGGGDAVDNAPPISGNAGTSSPSAPVVVAESGEKVDTGQGQVRAAKGALRVSSSAAGVDQPEPLFPESAYEKLRDVA